MVATLMLAVAGGAVAYVGPGGGLSGLGALLALAAAVLFAIIGFIWYPLKRLFRGRKARDASKGS